MIMICCEEVASLAGRGVNTVVRMGWGECHVTKNGVFDILNQLYNTPATLAGRRTVTSRRDHADMCILATTVEA